MGHATARATPDCVHRVTVLCAVLCDQLVLWALPWLCDCALCCATVSYCAVLIPCCAVLRVYYAVSVYPLAGGGGW